MALLPPHIGVAVISLPFGCVAQTLDMCESENAGECHLRNHHTMMKNQKTTIRKTMYHSQRHPCLAAILFMRRKVPARIPEVSENASFCPTK